MKSPGWNIALLLSVAVQLGAARALAGDDQEPWFGTPSLAIGNSLLSFSADAYGAAYTARQSGLLRKEGTTGAAILAPQWGYPLQNGWSLGIRTAFLLYHDRLSGDNYGNDLIEKAYAYLETAYGRIEAGQQDGAAYKLEVTGPLVVSSPAIDDAAVRFFIDPNTGRAFTNIFPVRTGVFATRNDAKISYYSPRSVDLQIGISFTPGLTKGLSFLSLSGRGPDTQKDITEVGANYVHGFGRLTAHAYGGLAVGWLQDRTPGHTNALDWALGGQVDYNFPWGTLAFGGAYRQSTGYRFDFGQSLSGGYTRAIHATTRLAKGPWEFGVEYSNGTAGAAGDLPRISETGCAPSLGYMLNPDLQLAVGYQHLQYTRSTGTFYDGKSVVSLDAGFLYLEFKV